MTILQFKHQFKNFLFERKKTLRKIHWEYLIESLPKANRKADIPDEWVNWLEKAKTCEDLKLKDVVEFVRETKFEDLDFSKYGAGENVPEKKYFYLHDYKVKLLKYGWRLIRVSSNTLYITNGKYNSVLITGSGSYKIALAIAENSPGTCTTYYHPAVESKLKTQLLNQLKKN